MKAASHITLPTCYASHSTALQTSQAAIMATPEGQRPSIPPKLQLDYQETIIVIVGPDQAIFTAHKSLIRSRAPFFAKAMSGEWKSAQSRTVTLSATKPDVFEAYLHWVYSSTVEMRFIQELPECKTPPS